MADSIVFNGFEIFQPGAYSRADLSALIRARVEGGGNIAVLGTAKGGEPMKVHHLTDPQQARRLFRKNSVLWEAIRLMYIGNNIYTAHRIYAVRLGNALKAQREIYSMEEDGHITKFVARDWGAWVNNNGVRVQILASDTYYLPDPDEAVTLAQASSGGSLATGTFYFKYSYINLNGETKPSPAANIAINSGSANKITVTLPLTTWPDGARQIRLYGSEDGITYYPITTTAVLDKGTVPTFNVTAMTSSGTAPKVLSTAFAYKLNVYTLLQNGNTAIQQYDNLLTQADMIARVNADAARDIGMVTAELVADGDLATVATISLEGGGDGEAKKAFGYYYTQKNSTLGVLGDSPSVLRFEAKDAGALGVGIDVTFAQDYIDEPQEELGTTASATGGDLTTQTYYLAQTYVNSNGETVPGPIKSVSVTGPTGKVSLTLEAWQTDADGALAATSSRIYCSVIAPNPGDYTDFKLQGSVSPPTLAFEFTTFDTNGAAPPTENTAENGYKLTVTDGSVTEHLRMFNDVTDVTDWSNDTGNTPRSTLVNISQPFGVTSADIRLGSIALHDGVDASPTPTNYQEGLDLIRYERVHILHPAGVTDEAIHSLFREHCVFMSNTVQRRERVCVVGAGALESVEQLVARASVQNSGRMQIVAPGMTSYNDDGQLIEYSGAYLAAQKCGISAGLDISEPSTHKYLPGITALSKSFLYSEIDDLIKGGICVAELDKDTGAFRIVRDVTTWIVDNTYAEFTIQRIVDNLSINMRRSLELVAVGKGITRTLLSRVKNETKRVLEDHKRRDIIFDWANIIVDHDFDQIFVSYQVAPVFPANFVLITQFFVPKIVTIENKVEDSDVQTALAGFAAQVQR